MANFRAERIKTTSTIDEQQHRKRQAILTKMRNRLLDAVLRKREIIFCQIADYPRGLFVEHQRINGHQIDVNFDGLVRCSGRIRSRGASSSWSCLGARRKQKG